MTEKRTCEIFVCINEEGYYEVGSDAGDTFAAVMDNHGGETIRTVKLNLLIDQPAATPEIEVDVPTDAGLTEEAPKPEVTVS